MRPPSVTYLTTDSIVSGVGLSQVLPYVERLAAFGLGIELHSFERSHTSRTAAPDGVDWRPHSFGPAGSSAGLGRVLVGAAAVRGADLVHARSDPAAAATLLARPPAWVWDVRSFWVDQRIALRMIRRGSAIERSLRAIERQAALRATAITTLTNAAIQELARRHGSNVAAKAQIVSTCVDLDRFRLSPYPDAPVSLLLSGSFNALYDLPTMLRLVAAVRRRVHADVTLLRPQPSSWDEVVLKAGGRIASSSFARMPEHVSAHHAGLSVCRNEYPAAIAAAMPTKIAEFLAAGRPVVVNAGLGDCNELLPGAGAGVVLESTDDSSIDRAAATLLDLLADPETPMRCRRLAEDHFDLERGVTTLLGIYQQLAVQ